MNRARVKPNGQLPTALCCADNVITHLIGISREYFRGEYFWQSGGRDSLGGASSPSPSGAAPHQEEDPSESGNSPAAQEFQPLEHLLPRGAMMGFDYEESVTP
jgi:hypothetical protein